jgi:hypothetical protein
VTSYRKWERSHPTDDEATELARVESLARQLRDHLEETADLIKELHVHGAASSAVQKHVAALLAVRLGFGEEVVLTPQEGLVTRARPDFFYRLEPGRGILAEVERGGTTTNNHDLKDLWKARVAPDAAGEAVSTRRSPHGRVLR